MPDVGYAEDVSGLRSRPGIAMVVTLAKFYGVKINPNWPPVIVVLLAAILVAALIIWRGWRKSR